MGEGKSRPSEFDFERRPEIKDKTSEEGPRALSSVERLISKRWETIIESWREFEEREDEEAYVPERYMAEVTEAWETRHERPVSERRVDTMSPFERASFLLALLVEQGAEWSANKHAAVRRATVGFIQQSLGGMTIPQQEIFENTVLANPDELQKIGKPREREQELVTQWIQDTVGRGVRR